MAAVNTTRNNTPGRTRIGHILCNRICRVAAVAKVCATATVASIVLGNDVDPLSIAANRSTLEVSENFCAFAPRDQLCDRMPRDVSDFNASLVYTLIEQNAQNPFDVFSWQSFVALNWPVDLQGNPQSTISADEGRSTGQVRWQGYDTSRTLFDTTDTSRCEFLSDARDTALLIHDYIQSGGQPLVDRYGNYVVYDTRINPEMATYIRENALHSLAGQMMFMTSGGQIDFPRGYYDNDVTRVGGRDGAIAIKSAWRVLDPATEPDPRRFFTRPGTIEVDRANSADGRSRCLSVKLGLVGFHIMRRTTAGNGGDWVWSTFEHVDNAPLASNARGPNRIFDSPLFADGCSPPQSLSDSESVYSFYRAGLGQRKTNAAPSNDSHWIWSDSSPYAGQTAPAQVTRCWQPARSTDEINKLWQAELAGSVLANYALSTTQWKGAPVNALFPSGEVPRYLTNSTMETYIQGDASGSCLGCHAAAVTAAGQPANFSFVFNRVPGARNSVQSAQSKFSNSIDISGEHYAQ